MAAETKHHALLRHPFSGLVLLDPEGEVDVVVDLAFSDLAEYLLPDKVLEREKVGVIAPIWSTQCQSRREVDFTSAYFGRL